MGVCVQYFAKEECRDGPMHPAQSLIPQGGASLASHRHAIKLASKPSEYHELMMSQPLNEVESPWGIVRCDICSDGAALTIAFSSETFTFHAQWLHDAKCDTGTSRTAATAYCSKLTDARIIKASIRSTAVDLDLVWQDGTRSCLPALWLRAYGPLVGQQPSTTVPLQGTAPKGWLANTLEIPHVDYQDIFAATEDQCSIVAESVLDLLLMNPSTGIIKIVNLPPPDLEGEHSKSNTLVTQVLKKLFGSVFQHPRRTGEKTFNVSSHHEEDAKRAHGLPNYDTAQVLLPHVDHAHYVHPIQIQGWYGLEGESENTFVSGLRALQTLQDEAPDLYEPFVTSQMAVGRKVDYYSPPLRQGAVDSPVTFHPGSSTAVKRFRWHAHLTGSLVTPFDTFQLARIAHQKFQEILTRDSHLLRVRLRPGDLYVWNNFTILHGRERVLVTPRTGVGQTVPEQVVADRYRELKTKSLKGVLGEDWVVHMPSEVLFQAGELVRGQT